MKEQDLFDLAKSQDLPRSYRGQRAKGSILPKGFWAGGTTCGIKKKRKKDLALFYSGVPTKAAGVFTTNQVKAASVILSEERLTDNARPDQVGGKRLTVNGIRAIIVNSGCANACTGEKGLNDAQEMCSLTARLLGIKPNSVLIASTGVIGRYLPMDKIRQGIKNLVAHLSAHPLTRSPLSAVEAILTTDTFPKIVQRTFTLPSTPHFPPPTVRIWACAKGAGMIHPDLATLLCFILTDLAIDERLLRKALKTAVDQSFNCITVDGETSTNDSVFILANGLAGNRPIKKESDNFCKFQNALNKVTLDLAKMIVKDGEGATKLVKIVVRKAKNSDEAMKVAKAIAVSPLVKTALFGADPNWGRIMAAIGYSGVKILPEKIDLYFNNLQVAKKGTILKCRGGRNSSRYIRDARRKARKILQKKEFTLTVDLNQGKANEKIYTCDLSTEYVKINSAYST